MDTPPALFRFPTVAQRLRKCSAVSGAKESALARRSTSRSGFHARAFFSLRKPSYWPVSCAHLAVSSYSRMCCSTLDWAQGSWLGGGPRSKEEEKTGHNSVALARVIPNRIGISGPRPHWYAWSRTASECVVPDRIGTHGTGPHRHAWSRTAFACIVPDRIGTHGPGPHCTCGPGLHGSVVPDRITRNMYEPSCVVLDPL